MHTGDQINIGQLIMQRATIQGFLVLDYGHRFEEAITHLGGMLGEGKLHYDETIVEGGIEHAPERPPAALHRAATPAAARARGGSALVALTASIRAARSRMLVVRGFGWL